MAGIFFVKQSMKACYWTSEYDRKPTVYAVVSYYERRLGCYEVLLVR